jgi:hypothetical protein
VACRPLQRNPIAYGELRLFARYAKISVKSCRSRPFRLQAELKSKSKKEIQVEI